MAREDNSLSESEKKMINYVLTHIRDQLLLVDNEQRQGMTVDSFIFNNHFTDSSAFNEYSSSVLKKKITNILGV